MKIFGSLLFLLVLSSAHAEPFWWSTPTELSLVTAEANAPNVVLNDNGDALCVFAVHEGDKWQLHMTRMPFEQSWAKPVVLKETPFPISHLQVVMNPAGKAAILWIEGSRLLARFLSFNDCASLETVLGEGKNLADPHLAINDKGTVVVVWERSRDGKKVIERACAPGGGVWSEAAIISIPESEARRPRVALNDAGTEVIVWEQEGIQAKIDGAERTLSLPETHVHHPEAALAPSGAIVALWERGDGFASSIEVVEFDPQGGWSAPLIVSGERENAREPALALNKNGEALIAWRSSNGEELQVRGVRHKPHQSWSSPFTLSRAGHNARSPKAVLNSQKNGVVIWRRSTEGISFIEGATLAQEKVWSEPFNLFDERDHASEASLALNDQGYGVIVWRQKGEGASFIQAESFTWQPETPTLIATAGEPVVEPLPPPPPPPPPPVVAELPPPPPQASPKKERWLVEVRGSAYVPQEKLFREVYNDVLVSGGLLVGYSFFKHWAVVATGDYMKKSGQTIGLKEPTEMRLIPVSLIVRYKFCKRPGFHFYFGLGPRLFIFKETSQSSAFQNTATDYVAGAVAETGLLVRVGRAHVDFFVAYSYGKKRIDISKTNIEGNSPNLGGLQGGLGVGLSF